MALSYTASLYLTQVTESKKVSLGLETYKFQVSKGRGDKSLIPQLSGCMVRRRGLSIPTAYDYEEYFSQVSIVKGHGLCDIGKVETYLAYSSGG